ncbi:MAG: hypothetical protein ACRD0U_02205 [Acidimicrobiales bacterium]
MSQATHLVRRFFGSLRPGPPGAGDDAWARSHLLPAEHQLWERMANADRRHAVGVGRGVTRLLGLRAERPVVAAALLHDVGKIVSGLRTPGRVVATVSRLAAGRGLTRRAKLYVRHPELGSDLLEVAGSDPLTVSWAREHHLPPDRWTVPADIAHALKSADDD